MQKGKASIKFDKEPVIMGAASIVGEKEGEGPLKSCFDRVEPDPMYGQDSWEAAESIRNSLYHKICARSRFFQAIGKYKAPLRFDRFLLVHLSFFYPGSEPVPCKCLCFSNHILIQIIICNPISAQSALYGNLVPHCAASEYGHIFNLHLNLP